jgi:hypothetical protein
VLEVSVCLCLAAPAIASKFTLHVCARACMHTCDACVELHKVGCCCCCNNDTPAAYSSHSGCSSCSRSFKRRKREENCYKQAQHCETRSKRNSVRRLK